MEQHEREGRQRAEEAERQRQAESERMRKVADEQAVELERLRNMSLAAVCPRRIVKDYNGRV